MQLYSFNKSMLAATQKLKTSCYSTDSQRPPRCCLLANNVDCVEYIDRRHAWVCSCPPKLDQKCLLPLPNTPFLAHPDCTSRKTYRSIFPSLRELYCYGILEMTGNGFLHSHSLPFPRSQFPFLPILIPKLKSYSRSHGISVGLYAQQNNKV